MQERGLLAPRKSRHRLTPGIVKFDAFHVLLEGDEGMIVLELAGKIQSSPNLMSSKFGMVLGFLELSSILEPGSRQPKTDKVAISSDVVRVVNHSRDEAEKLKKMDDEMLQKIKELKVGDFLLLLAS
ncbi:hypothetical protein PIB30_086218 [Stylosanthes scabra]|uniref:Uncharacterized protein n=1 Tax=Stylosanthes scabra TaxID=79078 RepID=A0ABU6STC4_9FABA|nr:hypothetical protein [Stylosanthes scabra]